MDLTTNYLGLELQNPLMAGASPLVDDLGAVRELEDSGSAAIVMHSLFEEQIISEHLGRGEHLDAYANSSAEAHSFLPDSDLYALGPHEYLEQLRRIKETVDVPVIASLNGVTDGAWLDYGKMMQDAGADALELNIYFLPTDPIDSSSFIESRILGIVRSLKAQLSIPVAVKLSPYFTALPCFANDLAAAGADGLILFNRYYEPTILAEELEARPMLRLSDSSELPLRLRWLAILSPQLATSLAVSGGVHTAVDAIKSLMAGADAVQIVSALLRNGPRHLATLISAVEEWLEEHEYNSLEQLRGNMNLERCPDPTAYSRSNYIKILQSWSVRGED